MNHPLLLPTRVPGPLMILCSGAQNENRTPHLDVVLYGLGNYDRFKLFEALCHREYKLHELMELTGGRYQAIRKHLITLEAYGLIISDKDGKERYYCANNRALRNLKTWSIMMDTLLNGLS